MTTKKPSVKKLEQGFLLLFLGMVTLAFAWLIEPFFAAIVWAIVVGVLFAPLYARLLALLPGKRNIVAGLTLIIVISLIIISSIMLGAALVQEATGIYNRIQAGEINFGKVFVEILERLPDWIRAQLESYGLGDFQSARERLDASIASSFDFLTTQVFSVGESALGFFLSLGVMLYLTFFLLRDGPELGRRVEETIPLEPEQRRLLVEKFLGVVQATIKGSLIVAIMQGTIGGVIFWALGINGALLWGVLMGFMSLLPAVGTGIVWVPVAIYLLVTGDIWQGVALAAAGVLVISAVDNFVRPILVGRETRIPDFIVLLSTLGGIQLFGFHGIVVGPLLAALFLTMWEMFAASRVLQPS